MRPPRSIRLRLFLVVWLLCALHFATNVVREHYPAMALAEQGDLRCDVWAGLSPDLFAHRRPGDAADHWYANNNVGASLLAAPLLAAFEPLLARLDAIGKRQAAADPAPAQFDSEYALRQKFMAEVRKRGIHLRLGAVAAITATLVMAPAAALLALLVHRFLLRRKVEPLRALSLTLVFALATPLLFRSAILNHNQLQALAAFASFVLLAVAAEGASNGRFAAAGLLAGATLLLDYSGLVLLAGLFFFASFVARATRRGAVASALATFVAAASFPVALLCFTQWWQFGDPFLPAQRWMPDAHVSVEGWHGLSLPSGPLLLQNLVSPSFGLFAFAPLLLLALLPPPSSSPPSSTSPKSSSVPAGLLLRPRERRFILLLAAAFVLFCGANRFTGLQWNTGFRALAPLVPFLFLAAADRLERMSPRVLALVAIPCALHAWVIAMARATPPLAPNGFADSTVARSWLALLERGIELPWLTVWRQTQPHGGPAWAAAAAPLLVLAAALFSALLLRPRGAAGARA